MDHSEYVILGKIGPTYGIQGWLKVRSFTGIMADILEYNPWYIENELLFEPIHVESAREQGKCLLVKFDGYNNPEQARLLTGKNIAIKRSELPLLAKNEYYWADLIGLTVINQQGDLLGKVMYLMETGANDVLVIEHQGKEYAVPCLPDVITEIDLTHRLVRIHWELI
ncbi:MAG: Ribosome maturation factor rimM [uncultured bacterium]|nr:MAG: Ribosome maturation factor rimM [uncultured bacterium]